MCSKHCDYGHNALATFEQEMAERPTADNLRIRIVKIDSLAIEK